MSLLDIITYHARETIAGFVVICNRPQTGIKNEWSWSTQYTPEFGGIEELPFLEL